MFSIAIALGGGPSSRAYHTPLPMPAGLRGYSVTEAESPLRAGVGKGVSLTSLAAQFCPTGRDLYLERRHRLDTPTWERHVLGRVVDRVMTRLYRDGLDVLEDSFEAAIVDGGRPSLEKLERDIRERGEQIVGTVLTDWVYEGKDEALQRVSLEEFAAKVSDGSDLDLIEQTQSALLDLVRFEASVLLRYLRGHRRFAYYFRPHDWMADARVMLSRLQTGVQFDSKDDTVKFGLSAEVKPDFVYGVTSVGDMKTGAYHAFYEGVATGYAIFAEYVLRRRINSAFILSIGIDIDRGALTHHRLHTIRPDDALRRRWVAQRDMARSVVGAADAPSHPSEIGACHACPYRTHCWKNGMPGTDPVTPPPPSRGPESHRSNSRRSKAGLP